MSKRGFAALSPERRRELATRGGRAAAAKGVGHRWTPEEARAAGALALAVRRARAELAAARAAAVARQRRPWLPGID
jgi:hypothetical protein